MGTVETASSSNASAGIPVTDGPSVQRVFLAHLRHELRTPIDAILRYAEMLIEEAEEEGAVQIVSDLEKIRSAGRELLDIVNHILDPAGIEQNAGLLDLAQFETQLQHSLRVPINTVVGYAELLVENARSGQRDSDSGSSENRGCWQPPARFHRRYCSAF